MKTEIIIKTSKSGKKYYIASHQKMAVGDAVCFSTNEFNWMLSQKLTPEQFDILYQMKIEDWTCSVIPVIGKEEHIESYKKSDSKLSPAAQLTLDTIYRTLKGKCDLPE